MKHKWKTNIKFKQIGLNVLGLFCIVTLCLGCGFFEWDREYTKHYEVRIKNNTNDTLLINTEHGSFSGVIDLNKQVLYPDSFISEKSGLYEEESPIPNGFDEMRGIDSCWIYKYKPEYISQLCYYDNNPGFYYPPRTSIYKVWYAPFRYDEDTLHSLYNYNSWEVINDPCGKFCDGIIQFTIYESDIVKTIE